jgi:hypothetical protein
VCSRIEQVLFLYEVDNIAFTNLLNRDLRVRIENNGRVELTPANVLELDVVRWTCVPLLTVGLVLSILVADWTGNSCESVITIKLLHGLIPGNLSI